MKLETFAKKTFLALQNPYQSVIDVRPLIIDEVDHFLKQNQAVYYVGVKNSNVVPVSLISHLQKFGFLWHTTDTMALGGRAVDIKLINPLTARPMSGSSSGSALNVFYGINDLGIGSDGGGSVLAPCCAINLYGFISPLFNSMYQTNDLVEKRSTDGIAFTPSIGFMARTFDVLQASIVAALKLSDKRDDSEMTTVIMPNMAPNLYVDMKTIASKLENKRGIQLVQQAFPDIYDKREPLISFLKETVQENTILISVEGPVDRYGIGDSVFGQYDATTQASQKNSFKGLLRVVNMADKSALIIPDERLGVGILLVCESNIEQITTMFRVAKHLLVPRSTLTETYFLNLDHYFSNGFMY